MDLITLYGKMGLSYIKMSDEEIEEELETISYLKEVHKTTILPASLYVPVL